MTTTPCRVLVKGLSPRLADAPALRDAERRLEQSGERVMDSDPDLDEVEMHLAEAYTRAQSMSTRGHLLAALDELGADVPAEIGECPRARRR